MITDLACFTNPWFSCSAVFSTGAVQYPSVLKSRPGPKICSSLRYLGKKNPQSASFSFFPCSPSSRLVFLNCKEGYQKALYSLVLTGRSDTLCWAAMAKIHLLRQCWIMKYQSSHGQSVKTFVRKDAMYSDALSEWTSSDWMVFVSAFPSVRL